VGSGDELAERVEVPARDQVAQRVGGQLRRDSVEVVGMAGTVRLLAQRQHRAAVEIQDRTILLVGGADPQHGEPGRRAARLR
jgi:hypothetical protein